MCVAGGDANDRLEELLENADHFRNRWGSQLIEISHVLMALGRDQRIAGPIFEALGCPSERLETELKRTPAPLKQKVEEPSKKYGSPNYQVWGKNYLIGIIICYGTLQFICFTLATFNILPTF